MRRYHGHVFLSGVRDLGRGVKAWKTSQECSTSRTDVNVERVRQMLQSDHRLSVRVIADELVLGKSQVWQIITEDLNTRKVCDKKERSVRDMRQEMWDANSWLLHNDNAPAHNTRVSESFWPVRGSRCWSNPLLTLPGSVWRFSLPQAQIGHQENPFWECGCDQKGRDDGAEEHPGKTLPGVHPSMAEEDGKVHINQGRLLLGVNYVVCISDPKWICCNASPGTLRTHLVSYIHM